jgi:hypothetical protein
MNAFAILAEEDDESKDPTNQQSAPTSTATTHFAGSVLDASTGQQLEHRQLRRHPQYKEVWDTSYANKLGQLRQGIGQDKVTPTKQRVEGTNTF